MEKDITTTQIFDKIYDILDKEYFHVYASYDEHGNTEWKVYYKCLIHEDYFSEENNCLLSSDKNTLEDVEKLQAIFEKEKKEITKKISLELLFSKSISYEFIRETRKKILNIWMGLYLINLFIWLICFVIFKDKSIGFYGTILMWLILICDILIDKVIDKQKSEVINKEIEEKTKMYIKGLGLNFLERIRINNAK